MLARERERSDLTLARCWEDVRRNFVEAEPFHPKVGESVDWIGQLYAIEAEVRLCGVEPRADRRKASVRTVKSPGTVTFACDLKSPESREKTAVDLPAAKQ